MPCDYSTSDAKLLHYSGLYLTASAARDKLKDLGFRI